MSEVNEGALRARIERAERTARLSSTAAGLSVVLVGVLTLSGWVQQEDTVSAQRFEVVDGSGDVAATLETSPGGAQLVLTAADGRTVDITADNSADLGMRVYDSNHARVQLTVGEDGTPALRLYDASRTARLAGAVLDGGPAIFLADAASTRRAALSQTRSGPSLRLFDETGEPRVGAVVSTDGPLMAVTGPSGRTVWAAP